MALATLDVLAFFVCCVVCVGQWVAHLCSAPEASDSDMCVLKRASKDACGSAGIMSTATISITIVASFPRYASCTNSYLLRPIQRGGARNNCDFVRWNSRVPVTLFLFDWLFLRQVCA